MAYRFRAVQSTPKNVEKKRNMAIIALITLGMLLWNSPILISYIPILEKTIARQDRMSRAMFKAIPPLPKRSHLGHLLESERKRSGVELGVQRGMFASEILSLWPSAKRYVLVDLWSMQSHYNDIANKENEVQEAYKKETLSRMEKFISRGTSIEICQNYTTQCADRYRKNGDMFDYIYVDARHDYKGVMIDLETWWPMLRLGGIFAGHDYVVNGDGPLQSGQNWSINYDGTVDLSGRAVKGAVDDFMDKKGLQISVTYREPRWNTWVVRKTV